MSNLITNRHGASGDWKILHLAANDTPHSVKLPVGPVLVPLAVWRARRAELIRREYEHGWPLGVWLADDEDASTIESDIDDFTVIALEFSRFGNGVAYLSARALRERYRFRGELRAIGDVPRTRLAYLHHIGFDTVILTGAKPGPAVQIIGAASNAAAFNQASEQAPQLIAAA